VSGERDPGLQEAPGDVQSSLGTLAVRLADARTTRVGNIVLRLSGKGGGTYRLACGHQEVRVAETVDVDAPPLIEVIGDAEAVRAILNGKVDARKQFLAGGIRVRGDLQYLSDLALELGLLKEPL
jgi:hydrogenase maturation factor HypE